MSNGHQDSNESRLSLQDEAKRKFSPGRILKAAIASFAACAMTLPALAAALPPQVFVTGSATGTITVTFTVAPPALSTVSCSVSLISNDPRAPSDSSSVTAPVSGSTATCVVTVNYRWRLTSANLSTDTMTIAYSVQGPVQVSSGLINIIPMPADGTHLSQSFGVTQ
jgi:hypothetical protein